MTLCGFVPLNHLFSLSLGKTLSFALPVVEKLNKDVVRKDARRSPRVLVLAPTRELAMQVGRACLCDVDGGGSALRVLTAV